MALRVVFGWLFVLTLWACVKEPYPPPEPPITVVFTKCSYDSGVVPPLVTEVVAEVPVEAGE